MLGTRTIAAVAAITACVVPGITPAGADEPATPPLPPIGAVPPPPEITRAPELPCTVSGSPRRDVLRGRAGQDVLCGLRGPDVLHLGGHDAAYGGAGNDRIEARNGRFDIVVGGAGYDRARVDATDLVIGIEKRL